MVLTSFDQAAISDCNVSSASNLRPETSYEYAVSCGSGGRGRFRTAPVPSRPAALRIAWMVLPDRFVDPILSLKTDREQYSSMLDQLALADFLSSGAYDSHVRRMRLKYQRRRDRLVEAVSPYASVSGIAAGMHAVLDTPYETEIVQTALERGIEVSPLSGFRHELSDDDRTGIVVSFGAPAFPRALSLFTEVLAACH